MKLSDELKRRLNETALTQMEIHHGTGVGQSTISRMKRGCVSRIDNAEKVLAFITSKEGRRRSALRIKLAAIDVDKDVKRLTLGDKYK